MGRLENKVALVTGGASGIGRAIVERFVAEGATVYASDINPDAGEKLASGLGIHFLRHDVASEDEWIAVIDAIRTRSGRLDVLVNNAGILGTGPLDGIDRTAWDRLLAVNLTSVMLGCKHGSLLMRESPGGGSIVNMSSNAALLATAFDPGYSATKGAVRLLTKSVAVDFARRGIPIRCNSVHPGPTDTPIFEPWRTDEVATANLSRALTEMVPMGRLGRPEEIAALVLFLASDESTFSTGSEFVADGGGTSALAGM